MSLNDPFGAAIKDFFENGKAPDLRVDSNYTEDESIPVAWFFRTEPEMPAPEKEAIRMCRGKILDVGAAAGCHAQILQDKGFDVTALEVSSMAAEVMKKRGILNTVQSDIYHFEHEKFDTILLLMNGTGIGGTLVGLKKLFYHLKTLLAENGQILIDSSDIKYLFEEEDGSMWIDLASEAYYGEMQYEVRYKKHRSEFNWLFVDFETLRKLAAETGLKCEKMLEGEHFDYLAKLTV